MSVQAWRPTLRYFACRSRGQGLRFALALHRVEFEDVRIPIEEVEGFRAEASDPGVGGPFAALPVLSWGDVVLAQTLAIAGHLVERLDGAERSPEERARLQMVAHAAHLEMQAPYSRLLWRPAEVNDDTLVGAARRLVDELTPRLGQLERLLVEAGPFFGGHEPSVADAFVYESLLRGRDVFGDAFGNRIARHPRLATLESRLDDHPALTEPRASIPFPVTASPSERALRERIRAFDLEVTPPA